MEENKAEIIEKEKMRRDIYARREKIWRRFAEIADDFLNPNFEEIYRSEVENLSALSGELHRKNNELKKEILRAQEVFAKKEKEKRKYARGFPAYRVSNDKVSGQFNTIEEVANFIGVNPQILYPYVNTGEIIRNGFKIFHRPRLYMFNDGKQIIYGTMKELSVESGLPMQTLNYYQAHKGKDFSIKVEPINQWENLA